MQTREEAVIPAGKTSFEELNLQQPLLQALRELEFPYCTPIQAAVLRYSLGGHDAIGRAQTGTGKTAAFLLTVLNDLLLNPLPTDVRYAGEPRALILAPTRELALQIAKDAKALAQYTSFKVLTLLGGMDYDKQRQALHQQFIDIVVATPGRLLDFAGKQDIFLDQVEILVIDEADRMLDMGFIPDVKRIVRQLPAKTHRQTMLFSATFTQDVLQLARQWTVNAVRVEIESEQVTADQVEQKVYILTNDQKVVLLYNLIEQENLDRVIVFANRRDQVRKLTDTLKAHHISCALLSGEVPQDRRIKTLEGFREGRIKVLVATDVAGRGIHIDGVSHVVNFTLPEQPEDYVHRIGRTGRAGARGVSISFASEDDAFLLPEIEKAIGRRLECEYPPQQLLAAIPPRRSHER